VRVAVDNSGISVQPKKGKRRVGVQQQSTHGEVNRRLGLSRRGIVAGLSGLITFSAEASTRESIETELPVICGHFRNALRPPGQVQPGTWYINDHCFFVVGDGLIHWFGIKNPYPRERSFYGRGSHPFVGHAPARDPFGRRETHPYALQLPEGTKGNIGACCGARDRAGYLIYIG
jgi:hypothetical protein